VESTYSALTVAPDAQPKLYYDLFVGNSPPMKQVYADIELAAKSQLPILLLGETGTGKDLVARAIHERTRPRRDPYIPVNLAALPAELVAGELFGHERGAFTGAEKTHRGVFERAGQGTVLLDEINCIPYRTQVSLLRVLESKQVQRLGGSEAIDTDFRLLAATNSDLPKEVEAKRFRQDLFHRLDTFRIQVPPLRRRREDIPELIEYFMAEGRQVLKAQITEVEAEVIKLLMEYEWPGNIRELRNVVYQAMICCESNRLQTAHLPRRMRPRSHPKRTVTFDIGTSLEEIEKEMVITALSTSGNNRTRAAELLGITRRAIYSKMLKHGVDGEQ
jgi:DNA-binding NtrC family response regulator